MLKFNKDGLNHTSYKQDENYCSEIILLKFKQMMIKNTLRQPPLFESARRTSIQRVVTTSVHEIENT